MERKEKRRKKGRKECSFPAPEWLPPSLQGKERNHSEPQWFQGKRRKEEREKKEERDAFRMRFLRGIQGKKDGRNDRKRMERMLFFSLSGGAFLSPEERRNPVVSREEEGKKEEKKDEVLGWGMGYLGAG